MPDLPTGTVTFLFADIDGSTRLLQRLGDDRYAELLDQHRRLVRSVIAQEGGVEVDSSGDAFFVAFPVASGAARAAIEIQQVIARHPWPGGEPPRVRIGLHTGEPIVTQTGYVGLDVHRAARVCSVGHGGQILLSETTHGLLRVEQLADASLKDLGAHRLKDLQRPERIAQLVVPGLAVDFPPLRSLTTALNNLPVQLTTFIGREREMAEIKAILQRSPLVTLTGPAGSGKTRLALQVAADLIDHYPDGVWLVELDTLTHSAQVAPAVAGVLHVPEEATRPLEQMIESVLRTRTALLILDNCEHLVDACARLALNLVRACPRLRILATSRQALRAMGEATYPVGSLPLPALSPLPPLAELAHNDAVALFVTRAQLSRHDFALSASSARDVARVVHRLEGIPLAIELAAARTRVLAVADIAIRLEDHLQLVINGRRAAGSRRHTLRGALDWSYNLLSEDERLFFRRLSVFSGMCRLEAAEAICTDARIPPGSVLDFVEDLVDKSLLLPDRSGELEGFRMLEIIREYSTEKLEESGEAPALRDRHLDYFLGVAAEAAGAVRGPRQQAALGRLSAEHDNLRAALRWCIATGGREQGLRLAGHLWWFWYLRGHWVEASGWLEALLGHRDGLPADVAIEPLNGAAYLAWRQGRYGEAEARAQEGLRLSRTFGNSRGEAHALLTLGLLARRRGAYADEAACYEQSLAAFRALGDEWGTARAVGLLAIALNYLGEYGRALALFDESRAMFRRMHDMHGEANATYGLARVNVHLGECARALELLKEAEALYRSLDDLEGLASVQHTRGLAAICRGDYPQARALLEASLAHFKTSGDEWSTRDALNALAVSLMGVGDYEAATAQVMEALLDSPQTGSGWDRLGVAEGLEILAAAEGARGRNEVAARWLGAASGLRDTMRAPIPPYRKGEHDALVSAVQRGLPALTFRAAFDGGRALTPDQLFGELRASRSA